MIGALPMSATFPTSRSSWTSSSNCSPRSAARASRKRSARRSSSASGSTASSATGCESRSTRPPTEAAARLPTNLDPDWKSPRDHATFRITVRGFFDALTEAQRSELLAEADQHDILRATYTPEAHLSYDLSARDAFAFRFLESGQDTYPRLRVAV